MCRNISYICNMENKKHNHFYWCQKKKRFRAQIKLNGKLFSIGSFKLAEDATKAVESFLESYNQKRLTAVLNEHKSGEVFVDISGYENKYQISNFGRVKSLCPRANKNFLKPILEEKGYCKVALHLNGKRRAGFIHILVAEAFLGHKSDGTQRITVDHIDSDKSNNHLDNLRLVSGRFNNTKDAVGSSVYPGVSRTKNNKWYSSIQIKNKTINLGLFDLELDAAKAYFNKVKELGHNVPEKFVNLRYHSY